MTQRKLWPPETNANVLECSPKPKDSLFQTLDHAWALRANQDIIGSIEALCTLKEELGIAFVKFSIDFPLDAILLKFDEADIKQAQVIETLIFWASILRAQKNLAASKQLLLTLRNHVYKLPTLNRRRVIAKLSQEEGINAYISNDFSSAVELFLTEAQYQSNPLEEWFASMNALLSLESLGLPQEATYQKALTAKTSARQAKVFSEGSTEWFAPLTEYERRKLFLQGHLKPLFDTEFFPSSFSCYQRLWMKSIPWHGFYQPVLDQPIPLEKLVAGRTSFFMQDFRVRTLQGRYHPNDLHLMPSHEQAMRIYMWTWRWLIDPDKFDPERILLMLSSPAFTNQLSPLPPLQASMLCNALNWLSLFEARHALKIENWAQRIIQLSDSSASIFSWELTLIKYFKALQNNSFTEAKDLASILEDELKNIDSDHQVLFLDILKATQNSDSAKSLIEKAPWLKNFILSWTPYEKGGVASHTDERSFFSQKSQTLKNHNRIVIDVRSHVIETSNRKMVSRHLARAASILKEKQQLSRSDFLNEIWGIKKYDSFVHDAKIMNILARLRALLGSSLRIGVKDESVYAVGDWQHVEFMGSYSHVRNINASQLNLLEKNFSSENTPQRSSTQEARVLLLKYSQENNQKSFTRRDLEKILNLPRSSANRMIERLVTQKIVQPVGQGPARFYKIQTPWEKTSL